MRRRGCAHSASIQPTAAASNAPVDYCEAKTLVIQNNTLIWK